MLGTDIASHELRASKSKQASMLAGAAVDMALMASCFSLDVFGTAKLGYEFESVESGGVRDAKELHFAFQLLLHGLRPCFPPGLKRNLWLRLLEWMHHIGCCPPVRCTRTGCARTYTPEGLPRGASAPQEQPLAALGMASVGQDCG